MGTKIIFSCQQSYRIYIIKKTSEVFLLKTLVVFLKIPFNASHQIALLNKRHSGWYATIQHTLFSLATCLANGMWAVIQNKYHSIWSKFSFSPKKCIAVLFLLRVTLSHSLLLFPRKLTYFLICIPSIFRHHSVNGGC